MDLQVIHNKLDFFIDKAKLWFSPEQKDSVLDDAQLELFASLQPEYGATQKLHDSLLPFKEQFPFTNASSVAGLIALPDDYVHLLAVETQILDDTHTLYVPVELLNESQISTRKSSQLIPISFKAPVCLLKKGKKVQLYPELPSAGTVHYLRRPDIPKFDYTLSGAGNRVVTYNLGASTQLQWDDPSTEKIIYKALGLLGVNVKDIEVVQASDVKDKSVA